MAAVLLMALTSVLASVLASTLTMRGSLKLNREIVSSPSIPQS